MDKRRETERERQRDTGRDRDRLGRQIGTRRDKAQRKKRGMDK